jgi:hypothetical protein
MKTCRRRTDARCESAAGTYRHKLEAAALRLTREHARDPELLARTPLRV